MKEILLDLEKRALQELEAVNNAADLEQFRIAYLGKKGFITSSMKKLKELPAQERPEAGQLANRIKGRL